EIGVNRVLAHDARSAVVGQAGLDFLPFATEVECAINVWLAIVRENRRVGCAGVMVRRVDYVNASRDFGRWRDVRPRLATITGHVDEARARPDPDHSTAADGRRRGS